jgi:hypothetical protein
MDSKIIRLMICPDEYQFQIKSVRKTVHKNKINMENMVYTFKQITNRKNCKHLILFIKNKGLETSHNPKVEGSNPSPATKLVKALQVICKAFFCYLDADIDAGG